MSLFHLSRLVGGDANLVEWHNNGVANYAKNVANGIFQKDKFAEEAAWDADYFDEGDVTTPTTSATAGIRLPPLANRVTLIMHPATRTAFVIGAYGYVRTAGVWVPLEPTATFGVSVTDASGVIQIGLDSALPKAVPFELGGAFTRLSVVKITASGGAAMAKTYALGDCS